MECGNWLVSSHFAKARLKEDNGLVMASFFAWSWTNYCCVEGYHGLAPSMGLQKVWRRLYSCSA